MSHFPYMSREGGAAIEAGGLKAEGYWYKDFLQLSPLTVNEYSYTTVTSNLLHSSKTKRSPQIRFWDKNRVQNSLKC